MCPTDDIGFVSSAPKVYTERDVRRAYWMQSTNLSAETLLKTFAGGECNIELAAEVIPSAGSSIRVSDRPKYIGRYFYDGRGELPKIERKLPPLLSAQLSFSELELSINNCDGKYNDLLIGGKNYKPLVGSEVNLKVGLRDVDTTYFPVFSGIVHNEGGVERTRDKITIRAREYFEYFNSKPPFPTITAEEFPTAPQDSLGKLIPIVLGDWAEGVEFADSPLTANVSVSGSSVAAKVKTTTEMAGGIIGYHVGDDWFLLSVGSLGTELNIRMENFVDCVLKRGGTYFQTAFNPVPQVTGAAGYWAVRIGGLVRASDGATIPYIYSNGDQVIVRAKVGCFGLDTFGVDDSNPINQARAFLYGAAKSLGLAFNMSSFSANWDTLAAKFNAGGTSKTCAITNGSSTITFSDMSGVSVGGFIVGTGIPAGARILSLVNTALTKTVEIAGVCTETNAGCAVVIYPTSAVGTKSRIWVGKDDTNVLEYVIGLLRQVRCDLFVNKSRKIDIISQHYEDVPQISTLRHIEQVHVLEDSVNPQLNRQNVMTSANASYAFTPVISGAARLLPKLSNDTAKTKMAGETAKTFELPNLYIKHQAETHLVEMLRFYSALTEDMTLSTAWVHVNSELGEWLTLSLDVGSLHFNQVLCQVRSIAIDPNGGSLELKLLSFGNFRTPSYIPENSSENLSGYDRIIKAD